MRTAKVLCCLFAAVISLSVGCTAHPALDYVKPADIGTRPFPADDAALVLSPDLHDFKILSTLHSRSEGYEYPVGASLYEYAQDAARACFHSVQVSVGTSPTGEGSVGIVLYPRIVKVAHVMPLFHDQQVTLVIEWTAKEPGTDKTIYVTTVEGKATSSMTGIDLGPSGARCIQMALGDLYQNTVAALANSSEIKQYLASRTK